MTSRLPQAPSVRPGGFALIATLAILTLVTVLLVTFVSIVSKDRDATHSYTQALRADQIALSGLDEIVSQLQAQIADKTKSDYDTSGTNTLYIPKLSADTQPQRMVPAALSPIVTMSGTNAYGSVTNFASQGSLTTLPSLNRRTVDLRRWSKPALLSPAATTAFASLPPQWIAMTRGGPQGLPRGATPASAGLNDAAPSNMKAAVGRYAYVVYDVSGLLDVNAAGYPSAAAASSADKGLAPWVDLSQLSLAISSKDVDALVKWRNATNYNAYAGYVTNWATNGFTGVAPGDTSFLSRQDLLQYVRTQRPALTNALPYLTTFSRELNGPLWGPTANQGNGYAYLSNAKTVGTANPLIYETRVKKKFVRANGLDALPGEPLVKYRFPLDKLALLEKVGTVYTAADYGANRDNIKADILKYFGLVLANDAAGLHRHWTYTNPAGGGTAAQILTIDQIAPLNREPDFFELLKAGILSGSLGKMGNCDTLSLTGTVTASITDFDAVADYQVIKIGANLIDQWDADSYPTVVTFNVKITAGEAKDSDFYGIEDLPYFNKVFVRANGNGGVPVVVNGGVSVPGPPYNLYLYYELWNPHQQTASATSYPTAFRIAPLTASGSHTEHDYFSLGVGLPTLVSNMGYASSSAMVGAAWAPWPSSSSGTNTVNGGWSARSMSDLPGNTVTVPATGATMLASYRDPALVGGNVSICSGSSLGAVFLGQVIDPATMGNWPGWSTFGQNFVLFAPHMILQLQYQDTAGWHTYATFSGLANNTISNYDKTSNSFWDSVFLLAPTTAASPPDSAAFLRGDPRTSRFGIGEMLRNGNAYPAGVAGATFSPTDTDIRATQYVDNGPVGICAAKGGPFFGRSGIGAGKISASTPYRLDMWAVNTPGVTPHGGNSYSSTAAIAGAAAPYYADNDGVARGGDACLSYPNASPFFTATPTARPVVLNRRFASVGDLGYVFRDIPWKTLDLFSTNSADAALLDLFTVSDAPVAAGRVNPSSAPAPVLSALLSGARLNPSAGTGLSPAAASAIAAEITASAAAAPFRNRSELVSFFATNTVAAARVPSGIKAEREAAVRALADAANTRTWNFLI
ncbi:MAG TPA: hypothetical protein VIM58_10845, partial [Candidatus Methylacidiphilales bacterium]